MDCLPSGIAILLQKWTFCLQKNGSKFGVICNLFGVIGYCKFKKLKTIAVDNLVKEFREDAQAPIQIAKTWKYDKKPIKDPTNHSKINKLTGETETFKRMELQAGYLDLMVYAQRGILDCLLNLTLFNFIILHN